VSSEVALKVRDIPADVLKALLKGTRVSPFTGAVVQRYFVEGDELEKTPLKGCEDVGRNILHNVVPLPPGRPTALTFLILSGNKLARSL
jgi:hypothetical protein